MRSDDLADKTSLIKLGLTARAVVRRRKNIAMVLMPMLLMGCTTAITLSEPETRNKVYSGTVRQVDLGCAHGTCLDFPFSLIADTLLLPITIPWTIVNFAEAKSETSGTTTSRLSSAPSDR